MSLTVILISILIVGLAIAGIAIKMFVKRDGEFTKSCSAVDTSTGERVGCVCGSHDGSECVNREKSEVSP